jgi:hypothetical protein
VTVHDDFSMLRLTREERFANTQEIVTILAIEGHTRPHAGMAEEVIANGR